MMTGNDAATFITNEPITEERARFYSGHFQRELAEIEIFWRRFPETFDFTNKEILDFGSGVGAMGIFLAKNKPKHITGIEIEPEFTAFSNYNLEKNYHHLKANVSYLSQSLDELSDESFDIIISKDVFEHVIDLQETITKLTRKLKPDGQMILGWGPLWYSPFGDHGLSNKLTGVNLPWAHLFIPEFKLLEPINKARTAEGKEPLKNLKEYGLNQEPFQSYRDLIYKLGLQVDYFNTNVTSRHELINKLPVPAFLNKYWIRTIYCKLTKSRH